jgi:sugar/nucleoside kinase (ribokinase family)
MTERRGILAGGNWIVDRVSLIDHYPEQDRLATIFTSFRSNGGAAYNVLRDLAQLQAPFPLAGAGLIGDDEAGQYILEDCRQAGIDTTQLTITSGAPTSFTEVMTVKNTGRRTFFHQPGANSLLDVSHFDLSASNARIFHFGYLLLLDTLDAQRQDGLTGGAILLREAKRLGFKTSADLVSAESDRFPAVVTPALPFIDYLFLNELEAERLTGQVTDREGSPDWDGIACAAADLVRSGVGELVCIHCPEGVFVRTKDGREFRIGSVRVPEDQIISAVGAGDALAAGILMGLHEGWDLEQCLELGVSAAAACLSHATCSAGVRSWSECLEDGRRKGFWDPAS